MAACWRKAVVLPRIFPGRVLGLRAFTDGQVALAEMLLNGRGGERNTEQAIALFDKAAAKNHSGAMFALGAIFAAAVTWQQIRRPRSVGSAWPLSAGTATPRGCSVVFCCTATPAISIPWRAAGGSNGLLHRALLRPSTILPSHRRQRWSRRTEGHDRCITTKTAPSAFLDPQFCAAPQLSNICQTQAGYSWS
jgi:hypothetical protein